MMRAQRLFVLFSALALPVAAQTGAAVGEKLTLRRVVALAVENSRDLKHARSQQEVAERQAGLRRSAFLPNLFTGSDVAYSKGFPLGAPQVFNLSYQQTVFDLPKRGELKAAQARAEMQRLEADRVRDDVIVRAASAYLELAKVRSSLELVRRERESARKIADVTGARAREGFELPIEVTRAQLTAARLTQRLVQLEGREETLENQLRSLLGVGPGQPVPLEEDTLPADEEKPASELVSLAVENSLEIKQAENERRAREERLKGERGGYIPTLEVVGQYGVFSRANNYDEFYNKFERHNVTIGLRARIPIFSSTRSATVSLARSELSAAEIDVQRRRESVESSVREQARRARELEATREVARLELALAQEDVKVLQAQFEEGRANLRDLEKARLEESDKWRAFLDSDFERQKAQLELLRTTGQLAKVFQ
jgi:outer membrane protein TolC